MFFGALDFPFNLVPAFAAILLILSANFGQDQNSIARESLFDTIFAAISLLTSLAKGDKTGIPRAKSGADVVMLGRPVPGGARRLDAAAWDSYFSRPS
jgi:hypothetical protein